MVCLTRDHAETCHCWKCESRRWFFEPPPEPKRVLVSTDETARALRGLGLSERAVARELGLSSSVVHKLMTPGRTVLRETATRALAFVGASQA
jgi:hypothetical protein